MLQADSFQLAEVVQALEEECHQLQAQLLGCVVLIAGCSSLASCACKCVPGQARAVISAVALNLCGVHHPCYCRLQDAMAASLAAEEARLGCGAGMLQGNMAKTLLTMDKLLMSYEVGWHTMAQTSF